MKNGLPFLERAAIAYAWKQCQVGHYQAVVAVGRTVHAEVYGACDCISNDQRCKEAASSTPLYCYTGL